MGFRQIFWVFQIRWLSPITEDKLNQEDISEKFLSKNLYSYLKGFTDFITQKNRQDFDLEQWWLTKYCSEICVSIRRWDMKSIIDHRCFTYAEKKCFLIMIENLNNEYRLNMFILNLYLRDDFAYVLIIIIFNSTMKTILHSMLHTTRWNCLLIVVKNDDENMRWNRWTSRSKTGSFLDPLRFSNT